MTLRTLFAVAGAALLVSCCATTERATSFADRRVPIAGSARQAQAQPRYDASYVALEERDAGAARMSAGFEHALQRRATNDAEEPATRPEPADCTSSSCSDAVAIARGVSVDDAGNLVIDEKGTAPPLR